MVPENSTGTLFCQGNHGETGKPMFFFFKWVLQLHPQIWHYYDILSHCTSESLAMAPHTALMFVLLIYCCFSCDCLTFLRYCCHNHKGLLHSRISCDDQRRRWWGRWMWLGARTTGNGCKQLKNWWKLLWFLWYLSHNRCEAKVSVCLFGTMFKVGCWKARHGKTFWYVVGIMLGHVVQQQQTVLITSNYI